tara:strand:- start:19181 stop:19786 length:606 start_codon:yes stop_codon:yes gene_type:complete
MKILIVPTIREIYNNQFEYCVDLKLINFIKKIFKNSFIEIFNNNKKENYDLVILAGGNNLIKQSRADKVRNKINDLVYNQAKKKRTKILGICHGAHFLSKKFGFKLKISKNHVGNHTVNFFVKENSFKKIVNSFHKETIEFKKIDKINIFGVAEDNTIEAFHEKNKKIMGIMWHPERYKNIKDFDKKLIKNFHATNSIISR